MLWMKAIFCSNFSKEPGSIGDNINICKCFLLQKKVPPTTTKDIFHCLEREYFCDEGILAQIQRFLPSYYLSCHIDNDEDDHDGDDHHGDDGEDDGTRVMC